MFAIKSWLGALSFAIALIAGNLSEAIAQNFSKSQRFVNDREIQDLESDFQSSIRQIRVDDRTQRGLTFQTNKFNDFVTAWQKVDPSIAPYIGTWATVEGGALEGATVIYPSFTKGKVCVVILDYFGSYLNLGTVVGSKLLVEGEIGKSVIIRKQSTLRSGVKVNSLASFSVFNGRPRVWAKVYPKGFSETRDSRIAKLGCTTSLPSQVRFNR